MSPRADTARPGRHRSGWERAGRWLKRGAASAGVLVVLSTLRAELLSGETASPVSLLLSAVALSAIALGFWRTAPAMLLLLLLTPLAVLTDTPATSFWLFTALGACFLLLRGAHPLLALGAVVSGYVGTAGSNGWLASEAILALTTIGSAVLAGWLVRLAIARDESAHHARDNDIGRRLAEERLRIARDLHDTVGHQVAALSMSIGVAEVSTPASAPPALREALTAARRCVQSINGETQRILEVMRAGSEHDRTNPVPSADRIGDLIASFQALGLEVHATLCSLPADIDREASTALYRMAQEALTNARKHGAGGVHIDLTHRDHTATLTVTNALPVASGSPTAGSGLGLVGMRERLASAGGTLSVSRTATSFAVAGEVPLTREGVP